MKPIRKKIDFEKVLIGEMLKGRISNVEYDENHTFKGFQGGEDTVQPAVRLSFELDGYKFPHKSRWMKFSYGAKSNLYSKYLVKLVDQAVPDMDFDLDAIKGMKVKTLWSEKGDFQNIDSIFPDGPKIGMTTQPQAVEEHHEEEVDLNQEPPF